MAAHDPPNMPLAETRSSHIKSGILDVISLAGVALVAASGPEPQGSCSSSSRTGRSPLRDFAIELLRIRGEPKVSAIEIRAER